MSWLVDRPIAHRGLHDQDVPENSLAAFQAAIDAGYAIELDVRLSADGVPVVFHDETLARLTSHDGRVSATAADRLTDLSIAGTAERIPRFAEVLARVAGQVPVLVELKNPSTGHALEAAVAAELDTYTGRFAIQSFNPISLSYVRAHRPAWDRGQLAGGMPGRQLAQRAQNFILKRLLLTWLSRPDFIAYEHTRLPYWPVTLHRRLGLPVLAWTVRTEQAVRRVQTHADNVIFEHIRP